MKLGIRGRQVAYALVAVVAVLVLVILAFGGRSTNAATIESPSVSIIAAIDNDIRERRP